MLMLIEEFLPLASAALDRDYTSGTDV